MRAAPGNGGGRFFARSRDACPPGRRLL